MSSIYDLENIADILQKNTYPGRGIIIGKTANGKKAAIAYFIMGRSENSRNRIFIENGAELVIHPYDRSKVEDPSLIIYSPIRCLGNRLIVTNGDKTDTIYEYIKQGKSFTDALSTRCFEPDAPNFTPRISGILYFSNRDFCYEMSILKSADAKGSACNRYCYSFEPIAGVGHFIHTYLHDGNPIPTFCGEPERIEIPDDIDDFCNSIWENLNAENKISLHVRFVDLSSGHTENRLVNKHVDMLKGKKVK